MIASGWVYLAFLAAISGCVMFLEQKIRVKIFQYLPGIVILYFLVMILASLGLWQKTESIDAAYHVLKANLLPAMIFLMLLGADMRQIVKLGFKMLSTFFLASLSIALGFIFVFAALHVYFEAEAWKAFAALCGSWMGGTGNMVAIQGALKVTDEMMGYVLLADSVNYAVWVMALLALVPFAKHFNLWSKADTSTIDAVSKKLLECSYKENMTMLSVFILLIAGFLASVAAQSGASVLPKTSFLDTSVWTVVMATLLGIVFAMTPLAKLAGSLEIGNAMLYLIVALVASRADFSAFSQVPLYVFAGFAVIAVHVALMAIFAKIFRLDLFSVGVASLANIGGVASAPILASAYSRALIPIGVLMAMMGYIIGTFGGLAVGKILQMLSA